MKKRRDFNIVFPAVSAEQLVAARTILESTDKPGTALTTTQTIHLIQLARIVSARVTSLAPELEALRRDIDSVLRSTLGPPASELN